MVFDMRQFKRVGECLYRIHTGGYYALIKVGGKQIKRSLRTNDQALAKRRLKELREKASGLILDRKKITFKTIAERWLALQKVDLKPASHKRRESTVKGLLPVFGRESITRITQDHIERWKKLRSPELSARSYNMEIETLRLILDYARDDLRLILNHPAERLVKKTLQKRHAIIPTKPQFIRLLAEMRSESAQGKSNLSADLVEFLGYSGCRLGEAIYVTWQDIDFERGILKVTGGKKGTKNSREREIPLFAPLKRLVQRMREDGNHFKPTDRLFPLLSAKKSIGGGCQRSGLPHFTHHDFRHFFCSNCIEGGVDFKTIAGWLGHQDGGVLVAKTYGHLRAEHSTAMAGRVTFDAATNG
jgi:integrase